MNGLAIRVLVDETTNTVDLHVLQVHPLGGYVHVMVLPLTPETAYVISNQIVDGAERLERAAAPRTPSDLQVRKAGELWSYECAAHPNEGLGLWHEQVQAFAAACEHYNTHHQE